MDMIGFAVGASIGIRTESRRTQLLVYRIVSKPTYKLPSRLKYTMAIAAKVMIFIVPMLLTYLGTALFALTETRPSAEFGGIWVGLIFCHYITCTVWLHLINRYITLPYELFTKKAVRWRLGVVYESEIPEYQMQYTGTPIWVTLSNATSALTQINYVPPFPTKKEKTVKLFVALIGMLFTVLIYVSTPAGDDGRRMMSIAILMAGVCLFALTVFRAFKPEY